MIGQVSAVQAGRIRDAARVTWFAGVVAIITFFVSFLWEPAIFGFAAWPIGFALLVLAFTPLFRLAGDGPAIVLALVGIVGVVVELIGLFSPPTGTQYRIGPIFGAGTVLVGAWFVGAGAIVRQLGLFTPDVGPKSVRGGAGLGIVGLSWFIDDPLVSLVILVGAIVLLNGIDPLLRQARRFGLPDPEPASTPTTSSPSPVGPEVAGE